MKWAPRNHVAASLAALLVCLGAGGAHAGEAYYLLMFGSQRVPANPNYSHTFATFVRAKWVGDGPCPNNPTLEAHTISWLPQSLVIKAWKLRPECGANFELQTTLDYALDNQERVSLWGPYQVEGDLYQRALQQLALLASGQVQYKANDVGHRSDRVSNCIHAVSSVAEGTRLRVATPGWGQTASFAVLGRFRPWVIDKRQVHAWVGSALGLDEYPIIYRDWAPPLSGGIIGPIYRALGGERNLRPTYGPPLR
jgi:hypothetical protein